MRPRDRQLSRMIENCLIVYALENTLDWMRSRVRELRVEREVV